MKATWQDTVLAESDRTIVVEGNHYFPPTRSKKNSSERAIPTRPARGKGWQVITTFKSVSRRIKTPPGTIRAQGKAANSIKSYVAFWRARQSRRVTLSFHAEFEARVVRGQRTLESFCDAVTAYLGDALDISVEYVSGIPWLKNRKGYLTPEVRSKSCGFAGCPTFKKPIDRTR